MKKVFEIIHEKGYLIIRNNNPIEILVNKHCKLLNNFNSALSNNSKYWNEDVVFNLLLILYPSVNIVLYYFVPFRIWL